MYVVSVSSSSDAQVARPVFAPTSGPSSLEVQGLSTSIGRSKRRDSGSWTRSPVVPAPDCGGTAAHPLRAKLLLGRFTLPQFKPGVPKVDRIGRAALHPEHALLICSEVVIALFHVKQRDRRRTRRGSI